MSGDKDEVKRSNETCGMTCPDCTGIDVIKGPTIYIEFGEMASGEYEEEGYADTYACRTCGFKFANLSMYDLKPI